METLVTPSERAQSLINPHIRTRSDSDSSQDKLILALKIMLGTPIPALLILYVCGLAISETFLACVVGATSVLNLLYILVDRFSRTREFRFFFTATDIPIIAFFLVSSIGTLAQWSGTKSLIGVVEISWVLAYYLISFAFFLFPGLNRLFRAFAVFVPTMCLFVLWQRFYGLRVNLSFLTDWLARAVSGIDTVGFYDSSTPYTLTIGAFVSFATAALFIHTARAKTFKIFLIGALALAWLSLVTMHSTAVLTAVLASVLVTLLYCQRGYFFLLLGLVALFIFVVPDQYAFYHSFTPSIERGEQVTQEKRDVAKAELQMFQDSPWFGVGYGPHQTRLPEYFKKIEVPRESSQISSNNYFAILASTGLMGFALFTLMTLSFFMKTHRLWLEIPRTHYWHRTFVMGCLGAQVTFHVLGLYQTVIASLAVMLILTFFLSVVNYLHESYARGIIPDDYSL